MVGEAKSDTLPRLHWRRIRPGCRIQARQHLPSTRCAPSAQATPLFTCHPACQARRRLPRRIPLCPSPPHRRCGTMVSHTSPPQSCQWTTCSRLESTSLHSRLSRVVTSTDAAQPTTELCVSSRWPRGPADFSSRLPRGSRAVRRVSPKREGAGAAQAVCALCVCVYLTDRTARITVPHGPPGAVLINGPVPICRLPSFTTALRPHLRRLSRNSSISCDRRHPPKSSLCAHTRMGYVSAVGGDC